MSGGIGVIRTLNTASVPVWQGTGKDIQLLQGGCTLVITGLVAGRVVPAGTPLIYDETARTATVLHSGIAYANAGGAAVTYQVGKNNGFAVGDYLASGATGGKAYAITAIDTTTSTDYDILTVGTTIGAVTAGDTLYASTATGATASALPACNGLLYDDAVVASGTAVSVVIRGTVYARRVVYTTSIAALAGLSKIIYSLSK